MPSCRVPRCKGNPMWGQRLSRACTLPSWKKSASGWPATRTEMRPAARTSSNLEAHTKLSERVSSGVTPFPSTRYCMTRTVSGPGPTSALDVPVAAEQVFEWSSIADGRRLVYEPVIGELLHQEVGDVCARDVGAPARFQIQPHTVVVRPRPVGQYHGTYDDPLQIALPQELLLCLFLCVLIPEQRRHEHLHEERAREPRILLALPTPHAVWHTKRRKPCSFIAAMMLAEPAEAGPFGSPDLRGRSGLLGCREPRTLITASLPATASRTFPDS